MQTLSIGETQQADLRRIPLEVEGPGPRAGAGSGLGVAGTPARMTIGVARDEPVAARDELDVVAFITRCASGPMVCGENFP
jgi:hypothetical protein